MIFFKSRRIKALEKEIAELKFALKQDLREVDSKLKKTDELHAEMRERMSIGTDFTTGPMAKQKQPTPEKAFVTVSFMRRYVSDAMKLFTANKV